MIIFIFKENYFIWVEWNEARLKETDVKELRVTKNMVINSK